MTMKKLIITSLFFFVSINPLIAETPHFLDFKLILNQSDAGKKAQNFLKDKLDKGLTKVANTQKNLLEEEKKLIQQKKILSSDDYKLKAQELRGKVASLQKQRNTLLKSVAKQRTQARSKLLKNLKPILKNYMLEKKIRMVIDKKNVLLADENLDITNDIMKSLNKKLQSIKLN